MGLNYSIEIAFSANKADEVFEKLKLILMKESNIQFNKSECLKKDLFVSMPVSESFREKLKNENLKSFNQNYIVRLNDSILALPLQFSVSLSTGKKWGYLYFYSCFSYLSSFISHHEEVKDFFVDTFSDCTELIWFDYESHDAYLLFPQKLTIESNPQLEIQSIDELADSVDDLIDYHINAYQLEQKMEYVYQHLSRLSLREFSDILDQGLPLNTVSYTQNTKSLLDLAIEKGRLDIAAYLIDKGINLEYPDEEDRGEGFQATSLALHNGYLDLFKLLLKKGARFEVGVFDKNIFFWHAVDRNDVEVLRYLFNSRELVEHLNALDKHVALRSATSRGHYQTAQYLSENGAVPNLKDALARDGFSLRRDQVDYIFWHSIDNDFHDVIRYLFEESDDFMNYARASHVPWNKEIALHLACSHGSLNVARLLIENGYSPSSKDRNGQIALAYALERQRNLNQQMNELMNHSPEVSQPSLSVTLESLEKQKEIINLLTTYDTV